MISDVEHVYDWDMAVMSDELREAVAEHERSAARLAVMVAEFDAEQRWDDDAATSMVAWLRDQTRMLPRDAQRLACCSAPIDSILHARSRATSMLAMVRESNSSAIMVLLHLR